jgi:hypothetical protein
MFWTLRRHLSWLLPLLALGALTALLLLLSYLLTGL